MAIKEKIKKKFGSLSAFARVIGFEVFEVHNIINAVENKKSGKNKITATQAYNALKEISEKVDAPKKEKPEEISVVARKKIRDYIVAKGVTVDKFAKKHKISRSYVYSIMNGTNVKLTPTLEKIIKFVDDESLST